MLNHPFFQDHGCALGYELIDGNTKGNGFEQMKNKSHGG